jgi:hypothetical protein
VLDFPIPDNDGSQPAGEPVVEGGPAAYFATLPIKAILVAWREAGLPGYVSNTAGTYVCNQTFYHSLHLSDLRRAFAARACKEYLWARRRAKASLESAGGRLQRLALASRSSSESERTKIGGFMSATISHNQAPALNVH